MRLARGHRRGAFAGLLGTALLFPGARASAGSYLLPLYCDLGPGPALTADFAATDSEDGASEDADADDCSALPASSRVSSADAQGSVRHRLRAEARVFPYGAEVSNELDLAVDAAAVGSGSVAASADVLVPSQEGAVAWFYVRREGAADGVLTATLENDLGEVQTFDFSDAPTGSTPVPLGDGTFYLTMNASSALDQAASAGQSLFMEVRAGPEPAAPFLLAAGVLVLAATRPPARRGGRARERG